VVSGKRRGRGDLTSACGTWVVENAHETRLPSPIPYVFSIALACSPPLLRAQMIHCPRWAGGHPQRRGVRVGSLTMSLSNAPPARTTTHLGALAAGLRARRSTAVRPNGAHLATDVDVSILCCRLPQLILPSSGPAPVKALVGFRAPLKRLSEWPRVTVGVMF
jgi:hypothetical protein